MTCKCGPCRVNGHNWVVLVRRPLLTSRLKCLACGWKWWSSRKYIAKLKDHRERSRAGMSDEDILARINDGSLVVDVNSATVVSTLDRPRLLKAVTRTKDDGSSYQFVSICHQGKKKKIALHRLVWMAANRDVVPEGYDIDHIRDKSNTIGNLRLMESSANRSRGKPEPRQAEELPF